jgi:uncharacterized membrane protein YhaH (DUF805 family)
MSLNVLTAPRWPTLPITLEQTSRVARKALVVLKHAANPRGRADRRGLFYIAVGLLAVQLVMFALAKLFGLKPPKPLGQVLALAMGWLAFSTTAKRLHDVGRSAWWIPVAVAGWIIGATGISTLIMLYMLQILGQDPSTLVYLYLAIFALPAFGGLLWMHCAPGETGDNFYGPETEEIGFSTPTSADIIGMRPTNPSMA